MADANLTSLPAQLWQTQDSGKGIVSATEVCGSLNIPRGNYLPGQALCLTCPIGNQDCIVLGAHKLEAPCYRLGVPSPTSWPEVIPSNTLCDDLELLVHDQSMIGVHFIA